VLVQNTTHICDHLSSSYRACRRTNAARICTEPLSGTYSVLRRSDSASLAANTKFPDTRTVSAKFASASSCFHPLTSSLSGLALLLGVNGCAIASLLLLVDTLMQTITRSYLPRLPLGRHAQALVCKITITTGI